ncbi:AC5 [Macroptilium golden yellow mosaic virus]|uniref:AC5 n=1 Tax=Macroptilium golden yellow mosaic virus TaxID=2021666 RepID=UPI000B9A04B8|nr:AC5 [Macroptilium golden yellow mosaic virus]AST47752.1 AC5 [Macroptilium golden yellow mosaic virus]
MILVFRSFLVVIDDIVVHLPKSPYQGLFIACILTTSHLGMEPMHNLETITKIVLDRSCTGFIVEHVEHLPKIHRRSIWSTVTDQPKYDTVRVVLELDVFIHPYLP